MQISLIEFSVENYKIFKERVTFSMLARKNDKHTFETNGENLLKTSLIYGPNASGKSTLLDALENMRIGVINSANNPLDAKLPHLPFLASQETLSKETFFEIVFSMGSPYNKVFRYNFSFVKDFIVSENLFEVSENSEDKSLFSRNHQTLVLDDSLSDAKINEQKMRPQVLFLSVSAQWNIKLAVDIVNSLSNINIISGINAGTYGDFTTEKFKGEYKDDILNYLAQADFCISEGRAQEIDVQNLNVENKEGKFAVSENLLKKFIAIFGHTVYDKDKKKVGVFELSILQESAGTQRFFSLLGPIINTLKEGKVLFIDEFDNSLHPSLTKYILSLFESKEINKNKAQLITTAHDTSLLSYKDEFIKDQFWFTEKDEFGAARLFSLAEFELRNDTEFSRKYLEGRFGALPFISSVEK